MPQCAFCQFWSYRLPFTFFRKSTLTIELEVKSFDIKGCIVQIWRYVAVAEIHEGLR